MQLQPREVWEEGNASGEDCEALSKLRMRTLDSNAHSVSKHPVEHRPMPLPISISIGIGIGISIDIVESSRARTYAWHTIRGTDLPG